MTSLESNRRPSVLAIITHYRYEEWLAQCIKSLVDQTRPPEGIVVVDDASPRAPVDIVRRFPGVTLLVAAHNVGLYRLVQQVITDTAYDWYMFQDADDWSSNDRLALLVAEAERTEAELVGTQENRLYEGKAGSARHVEYPIDCNAALIRKPKNLPILLGSAIVARHLVQRLGGFATGLRYSADVEFVRRVGFVAKIVNVPQYCYFRRVHPNAATQRPETGMRSPLRKAINVGLTDRWRSNLEMARSGLSPDLTPFAVGDPVFLSRVAGPQLAAAGADH